jgi:predicted nucleic acid-binding protein
VDPNVLISAAIAAHGTPRALLFYWYEGRFQMLVSYDLLYELEAVLLRPRFRRKLTVSDVIEYVSWLRESALFVNDAPRWRSGSSRVFRIPTTLTSWL